jgi:hypothetical protein
MQILEWPGKLQSILSLSINHERDSSFVVSVRLYLRLLTTRIRHRQGYRLLFVLRASLPLYFSRQDF